MELNVIEKYELLRRMPLSKEDLKPNKELKARIEAWKQEHNIASVMEH